MKIPFNTETNILLRNNTPVDDFLGLSSTEIHHLLYDTFGENSPIQFRKNIDDKTLDQIPLFRIAEEFLKIIYRDKQIMLTPLGALPKKVVVELYDKRFLLEELVEKGISKLWREEDSISIRSARFSTELAGLVRKANGKLTLTKTATKLLDTNNRLQIFRQFFQAFTDKYLRAFSKFIRFFRPGYSTPEQQFFRCYGVRTFDRFFLWFGFVTVEQQNIFLDLETDKFKRTDLQKSIFEIDDQ